MSSALQLSPRRRKRADLTHQEPAGVKHAACRLLLSSTTSDPLRKGTQFQGDYFRIGPLRKGTQWPTRWPPG